MTPHAGMFRHWPEDGKLKSRSGTPVYMAPEVVLQVRPSVRVAVTVSAGPYHTTPCHATSHITFVTYATTYPLALLSVHRIINCFPPTLQFTQFCFSQKK